MILHLLENARNGSTWAVWRRLRVISGVIWRRNYLCLFYVGTSELGVAQPGPTVLVDVFFWRQLGLY